MSNIDSRRKSYQKVKQLIIQHARCLIKATITKWMTYELIRNTLTWLLVIWLWFTNPIVGSFHFGLLIVPLKIGVDRVRSHRWSLDWLLKRINFIVIGPPDCPGFTRMHHITVDWVTLDQNPFLLYNSYISRTGLPLFSHFIEPSSEPHIFFDT